MNPGCGQSGLALDFAMDRAIYDEGERLARFGSLFATLAMGKRR